LSQNKSSTINITHILENELSIVITSANEFIVIVGLDPIKHLLESEFQWHSELDSLALHSISDNLPQTYLQLPLEYTHLSEFVTKLNILYTTSIIIQITTWIRLTTLTFKIITITYSHTWTWICYFWTGYTWIIR
jgi:hypothetical protein